MAALNNTAESGTIGATVTTGNSGGASGDAWDTVQIGANASLTYVESPVMVGKRAYRMFTGVTSTTAYLQWSSKIADRWPAGLVTNYGETYFSFSAAPAVDTTFVEFSDAAGTTNRGNIRLRSTSVLRIRNAANGTVVSGTVVLSPNTVYRIEWQLDGSVAGSYQLVLFLGNSTSPLETLSGSANFGGTIGTVRFGFITNIANSIEYRMDSPNVNDVALPGPAAYRAICPGVWAGPRCGDGMLPAHQVADDFADNAVDGALWTQTAFGSVTGSETGGTYQFAVTTAGTGGAQLRTQSRYDMRGDYFAAELVDAGVAEAGLQAYAVMAELDSSNQVYITVSNGFMGAIENVAGVTTGLNFVAYDPALHRWFRVREFDGDTFWEVSANGVFWTEIWSAASPIALNDVTLLIATDTFLTLGGAKTVIFGQVAAPVLTA
jgi:hypothetical protein